jgi:hypothetical protein
VPLCSATAGICNVHVAGVGSQGMLVSGIMWNAGVAASRYKTAMNRLRVHRINHEKLKNNNKE